MSDFTNARSAPVRFDLLVAPLRAAAKFFDALNVAVQRNNEYQALSRLSDAELERRGLAREDLVRHVFAEIE
ncbi:DUF1127 domain-containing protein [Tropicimonas sp.]|uniref:DUF1127 domain-containing protein n=1 Tax=Tropicimonas sp. TaxID=2067044 RepID=UPI003A876E3F